MPYLGKSVNKLFSCSQPFVSVIMPVRNEAGFIERSLSAVLAQDYPSNRIEVIVADGTSTDGTREILSGLQGRYPQLQVIDNPSQNASSGLNAALDRARGEVIIRIDGHSLVARDFVKENVAVLQEQPQAWSVGGPIVHTADTLFGKAAAMAMSHPFGVGNAFHRFSNYEGYAEGAQFPAMRRWVFERVGRFDEQLVRNQDDEFNYRIRKAGGKIYITPRIRYTYYVREETRQLFRQYFQYGFWRIKVISKHRRLIALRQLIPALFYLAMPALLLWGLLLGQIIIALILPAFYAAVLIIAGLSARGKAGFKVASLVPLATATIHAGYALGFIYGLWASIFNPKAWDNNLKMTAISR